MLVFSIEKDEVKNFMNKLLKEDIFDNFEVRSFEVETIVKYEIMGNINQEYLSDNEERFFVKWKELKPFICAIIKGNKKPKYMKMIFSLEEKAVENLCENAKAMFLNVNYANDEILVTTGTSQKSFSLAKMEDKVWEDAVLKFFAKNEINININV